MIEHFIITVLVIYGIHGSTRSGMILDYKSIDIWIFKRLQGKHIKLVDKTLKVICDCTPCMASLYGTVSFFLVRPYPSPLLLSWAVWVFSLCGFNYILNKIINK